MTQQTLLAFNQGISKSTVVANARRHQEADTLLQGKYWNDATNRGCAVGCTLHDLGVDPDDHSKYPELLGIPETLAHLQDRIFEGLAPTEARKWPLRFWEAIPTDADLSLVWPRFAVWLLTDLGTGATVIDLYKRVIAGATVTRQEWHKVASVIDITARDSVATTAADVTARAALAANTALAAALAAGISCEAHFSKQADMLLTLLEEATA